MFLEETDHKMLYIAILRPSRGFGSWGERLFIFKELGSTGKYFRGAGRQAHTFES